MRFLCVCLLPCLFLAASLGASGEAAAPPESPAPAVDGKAAAASPEASAPEPEPEGGGTIRGKNLWETFSRGGALMYPILLCSLMGMAFALERFISLRQSAVAPKDLPKKIADAVGNGGAADALRVCDQRPSSMSRVIKAGLALADGTKEEMTTAMQEAGERELWGLERLAKPLNVIAGVAPLLGLLGTVWGMIMAFDVVAAKGALGDPRQLAGGIATALLTTLAGLTVAIPCYVLYHYFRSKSDRMMVEIEEAASHVVNLLRRAGAHAHPSPPPGGGRGAAPDAAD